MVSQRADGTVIRLVPIQFQADDRAKVAPVVEFHIGDERHEFQSWLSTSPPQFDVGEKVVVLYDAQNPERARIESFVTLWLFPVVFGGIAFLSLFDFARGQLEGIAYASQSGSRGMLRLLISWTFAVLRMALLVRVISSWVRVSPYSPWVRWAFVLSEPILRPLRQIVPSLGMVDITPIVAYLLLGLLERFLVGFA